MKKLPIFALMGMSTLLAGCTIPGVPDPQQVADQTRMLTEMQQQMTNLLSGMNALQEQNEQMSGVLVKLQAYIESQKPAIEATDRETHGSAPLSDLRLFGGSGSFEDFGSGAGLPGVEMAGGALTGDIGTGDDLGTGSIDNPSSHTNKNLLLEELKKAASKKSGSSGNTTTGTASPML